MLRPPAFAALFAAFLSLAFFAGVAHAAPIPGLFNTGVDAAGVVLPGASVDPHYTLTASADPNFPGPAAIVASVIPSGFWAPNNALSKWTCPANAEGFPSGGEPHPGGQYAFRLDVDLSGFDPSTVTITGTWAADNNGTIRLNGAATGNNTPGYNPLTAFTLNAGFVAGVNHIDFIATNSPSGGSNPTGVRVEGIAGTGTPNAVGVGEIMGATSFGLGAPYPNPTQDVTHIRFSLARPGPVRLVVRDLAGRTVRTLMDGATPAGLVESSWEGRLADGSRAGAGVYFVELSADSKRESRRIVLVR